MLKRLVTLQELIETSAEITLSNINLDLDLNTALQNWDNLTKIDRQTFRIQQYLDQAGRQIDSLSNGQIYNMWDYLNQVIEAGPNQAFSSIDIANFKRDIDTIKYVVIQWVEYFIQTNKIFSDTNIEAPSNLTFNIQGQSSNSDIERKRLDLINTLNTTFFFNKIYVSGNVEQDRFNPLTDLGQFEDLEIGNIDSPNYKFKNGYIVKDVDYLGLENKNRLDLLEPRVNTLEQNQQGLIDRVNGIQDNVNTLHRQVEQNKQDIAAIKGGSGVSLDSLDKRITTNLEKITNNTSDITKLKQQVSDITGGSGVSLDSLDQRVTQNRNNITQNRSDLGGFYNQYTQFVTNIRAELQDVKNDVANISNDIKFRGIWNASTTYNLGDQVSYEDEFYVSLINNNLGITPKNNPTQWKQPDKAIQSAIDTSINKLREQLQPQIDTNQRNITSNTERLNDYFVDLNALTDRVTINETHIRDLQSLTNTHTQQINNILGGSSGISLKTLESRIVGVEGRVSNLEGENATNKSNISSLQTNTAKLNENNTYASGKRNIFNTLPEVYTQSTLPTKNTEFTTKKYVDDLVNQKDTSYAKLGSSNTFSNKNIFNDDLNIKKANKYNVFVGDYEGYGRNALWLDETNLRLTDGSSIKLGTYPNGSWNPNNNIDIYVSKQNRLNFFKLDETSSEKTKFSIYRDDNIDKAIFEFTNKNNQITTYSLNENGTPTSDKDLTTKKYVDEALAGVSGSGKFLDLTSESAQTVRGLVNLNGGANISGYRALTTQDGVTLSTSQTITGNKNFTGEFVEFKRIGLKRDGKSYGSFYGQEGSLALAVVKDSISKDYRLNFDGPTYDNDIVNKGYVDSYVNSNYQRKIKYVDYTYTDMTWVYTRGHRYMEQYHFLLGSYSGWGTTSRVIGIEFKYDEPSSDGEWWSIDFNWMIPSNSSNKYRGRLYCWLWDNYDPHGDRYDSMRKYCKFRVWYIE